MPAIYAHDRFGREVASKLSGEIKRLSNGIIRSFRLGAGSGYFILLSSLLYQCSGKIRNTSSSYFGVSVF